jgi:hypothetical protein
MPSVFKKTCRQKLPHAQMSAENAAMKSQRPHRLRRTLLILGVCWMVLSTAWVARRWWAVRILEKAERAREVKCEWDWPNWSFPLPTTWRRVLPTARISWLNLDGQLTDGAKLAWAVRTCGGAEELLVSGPRSRAKPSLDAALPAEKREFLLRLGRQPTVLLALYSVRLGDDEMAMILSQFPKLEDLTMHGGSYSGAKFPLLPSLESVDLHDTPFTDEGLAAVLRSAALRECVLEKTAVTPAGLLRVSQEKPKSLESLRFVNAELRQEAREQMQAEFKARWPGVAVEFMNEDADE